MAFSDRAELIPEELVHQADVAMYEAKRSGGDRHRIASPAAPADGPRPFRLVPTARTPDGVATAVQAPPAVEATGAARPAAAGGSMSDRPSRRAASSARGRGRIRLDGATAKEGTDSLEVQLAAARARGERLEAQLGNLADHDPLTDLLSRRSIEEAIEEHLAVCRRYGPEGAFLLLGVDGLVDAGGGNGSQGSQEALAQVAEVVLERLRGTDVAGRWASDELAILVPRGSVGAVAALADALLALVHEVGTPPVQPGSLTASIGVAPVDGSVDASAQLVASAHRSMLGVRRRGGGAWATGDGAPIRPRRADHAGARGAPGEAGG